MKHLRNFTFPSGITWKTKISFTIGKSPIAQTFTFLKLAAFTYFKKHHKTPVYKLLHELAATKHADRKLTKREERSRDHLMHAVCQKISQYDDTFHAGLLTRLIEVTPSRYHRKVLQLLIKYPYPEMNFFHLRELCFSLGFKREAEACGERLYNTDTEQITGTITQDLADLSRKDYKYAFKQFAKCA